MNYPIVINNILAQAFHLSKLRVRPTANQQFVLQAKFGNAWVSIHTLEEIAPANDTKPTPPPLRIV